jgi:nicotinate-nucleotide pyrophosphorylase (carboxylating)
MNWNSPEISGLLEQSLIEDLGPGDITSRTLFPDPPRISASFLAKDEGVLAGLPLVPRIFRLLDRRCRVQFLRKDGDRVRKGTVFCRVSGPATALLGGERLSLNFLQRLSGIATRTALYVSRAARYGIQVLDTRKTTPLLRSLEKYAVTVGGGVNHRFGLYDAVLVKDNHLMLQPDFGEILRRFKEQGLPASKVEIEVTGVRRLREAIESGAKWFLLDNMKPGMIRECVRFKKKGMFFEVSGGITPGTFDRYLIPGVDAISIGGLTHSVGSLDISLEMDSPR